MSEPRIRLSTPADAEAILAIYTPYVTGTTITFEYDVPAIEEMRTRIQETHKEYPFLVHILDGRVSGYAYAHRLRERAAYQWDAELSVYVDGNCHHRGIGRALYTCLMELLKLQNVVNVYGVVTVPNAASEKLHEQFGFRLSGVLHNTGFKHGHWLDVAWYEKNLVDWPADPQPFLPFPSLDRSVVDGVISRFSINQ
jgi:phosphinothricin acetyltransferase